MKKSKLLADTTYDGEVERLSGLPKFPMLPAAQKELRNALRRISESDADFIHRLISDVVDTHSICPTPAELIQIAGAKRHRKQTSVGRPDCPYCEGSGFVISYRTVAPEGFAPYETSCASVCTCRGGR